MLVSRPSDAGAAPRLDRGATTGTLELRAGGGLGTLVTLAMGTIVTGRGAKLTMGILVTLAYYGRCLVTRSSATGAPDTLRGAVSAREPSRWRPHIRRPAPCATPARTPHSVLAPFLCQWQPRLWASGTPQVAEAAPPHEEGASLSPFGCSAYAASAAQTAPWGTHAGPCVGGQGEQQQGRWGRRPLGAGHGSPYEPWGRRRGGGLSL